LFSPIKTKGKGTTYRVRPGRMDIEQGDQAKEEQKVVNRQALVKNCSEKKTRGSQKEPRKICKRERKAARKKKSPGGHKELRSSSCCLGRTDRRTREFLTTRGDQLVSAGELSTQETAKRIKASRRRRGGCSKSGGGTQRDHFPVPPGKAEGKKKREKGVKEGN